MKENSSIEDWTESSLLVLFDKDAKTSENKKQSSSKCITV